MIEGQMELSLAAPNGGRWLDAHQRRRNRAHWWFERMRQTVDQAFDWPAATLPGPEQPALPAAGSPSPADAGATAKGTERNPDEQQVCE
jgi:hypothetical protein